MSMHLADYFLRINSLNIELLDYRYGNPGSAA